ncbi:MAG: hypothetical protein ACXWCM_09835, partial [Acidimicrobiales bacterium]
GNFSAEPVVAEIADAEAWGRSELLIATGAPDPDPTARHQVDPTAGLRVDPWGSRVYRRQHAADAPLATDR